jgi:hypothetical protein
MLLITVYFVYFKKNKRRRAFGAGNFQMKIIFILIKFSILLYFMLQNPKTWDFAILGFGILIIAFIVALYGSFKNK